MTRWKLWNTCKNRISPFERQLSNEHLVSNERRVKSDCFPNERQKKEPQMSTGFKWVPGHRNFEINGLIRGNAVILNNIPLTWSLDNSWLRNLRHYGCISLLLPSLCKLHWLGNLSNLGNDKDIQPISHCSLSMVRSLHYTCQSHRVSFG